VSGRPVLLFLCVQNAGRSRIAAAYAHLLGGDRVEVLTGGSAPAERIHPAVVEAMREEGIDLAAETPRKFTEADVRSAGVVVTMGCGDECPAVPGRRFEDWKVADPAGEPPARVRAIRDAIRDKVEDLLWSLGIPPAARRAPGDAEE
jgi:protein-tyrosine-phosphatase